MTDLKFIFAFIVFSANYAIGQNYLGYSNDSLLVHSEYLKETIRLNLHLPETHNFSAESTKYPIILIFDSQHESTYPQIINSIDLLTNESQMPEAIIVGISLNRNNRYYFTSSQTAKEDSLSGIERMEKFLFEELIPKLQKEYKGNDFIMLVGHSRTAFLVNYLTVKQSEQIDVAIALSGFYSNKPLSVDAFKTYILDASNFPNLLHYYFTAGTTLEEVTYLTECQDVFDHIANSEKPSNFRASFSETKNANHITNYWVSVPPILMEAFSEYNSILNNWFYIKLKGDAIKNPIAEFKADLNHASERLGFEVNPSITQILSLASSFGYERNDLHTAIEFIKLGQKYYPSYADFDLELIAFYASAYRSKVQARADLSAIEKAELLLNIKQE
jgi:enterochelin esterase-like enzyme